MFIYTFLYIRYNSISARRAGGLILIIIGIECKFDCLNSECIAVLSFSFLKVWYSINDAYKPQ